MKRPLLLAALLIAGYHDDSKTWVRLYIENRVSRQIADEQWRKGQTAKKNGARCSCHDCNK